MSQPAGTIGWAETTRPVAARRVPAPLPPRPAEPRPLSSAPVFAGLAGAVARALEDRRLFVLLPFAIIAGLICSLLGASQPEPALLAAGGVLAAAALPLAWRSTAAARLLSLAACFWLGLSLLAIHGALFGTGMLARPAYGVYQATVDEVLSSGPDGQRVVVSAIVPTDGARGLPIRRARIAIGSGPAVAPGDIVRGPIRFYPVPGPVLPGAFDTQFHAYFDGIGAYGSTTRPPEIVTEGDHSAGSPASATASAADRPRTGQPEGSRGADTDQSAVDDEARAVSDGGLRMCSSGLHLTLVAGGSSPCCAWRWRSEGLAPAAGGGSRPWAGSSRPRSLLDSGATSRRWSRS